MLDVAIVGGGISGLSAALSLSQQGLDIKLFEASPVIGGWLRTYQEEGYTIEAGPHTVPSTAKAVMQLCQQFHIEPVPASAAAKNRYILHNGRLVAVPRTPLGMAMTPLLSSKAKLRAMMEWRVPQGRDDEETVAAFVRRRFGAEVLEAFIDPFVSGVYAGHVERLSVEAAFPLMQRLERHHGSVIRGAVREAMQYRRRQRQQKVKHRYGLVSFQGGMGELPLAMADSLPMGSISKGVALSRLEWLPSANCWQLGLADGAVFTARAVVLATPAYEAGRLCEPLLGPSAINTLKSVFYAPVAVVHLGFPRNQLPQQQLNGFGFLVPSSANMSLLGCLYASTLFPERAPAARVLLTCFVGGAHQPDILSRDPSMLAQDVLANLGKIFGRTSEDGPLHPDMVRVLPYGRAIPQFPLGHLDRMLSVQREIDRLDGPLALAGNYLKGVSVDACVEAGQRAAEQVVHALRQQISV